MNIQNGISVLIAAIVAWIAYGQYHTNLQNHRFALYDKRFKVFTALMEFLSHIIREADINNTSFTVFLVNTNEAYFLFGKDNEIEQYLKLIANKASELRMANLKLTDGLPVGKQRSELAEKRAELCTWFFTQIDVSKKLFGKYLTIK
ncbi:MAG: hypothetical protein ACYDEQ_01155 [Desulfocucumaceae bacterium]